MKLYLLRHLVFRGRLELVDHLQAVPAFLLDRKEKIILDKYRHPYFPLWISII